MGTFLCFGFTGPRPETLNRGIWGFGFIGSGVSGFVGLGGHGFCVVLG